MDPVNRENGPLSKFFELHALKRVIRKFQANHAWREGVEAYIESEYIDTDVDEHLQPHPAATMPELRFEHQDYQDAVEQAIKLEAMRHCLCSADIDEPLSLGTILTNLEPKQAEHYDNIPIDVRAHLSRDNTYNIQMEAMCGFLEVVKNCLLDPHFAPNAAKRIADVHRAIYQREGQEGAARRLYDHVIAVFKSITP